jgi:hypothetical protein
MNKGLEPCSAPSQYARNISKIRQPALPHAECALNNFLLNTREIFFATTHYAWNNFYRQLSHRKEKQNGEYPPNTLHK